MADCIIMLKFLIGPLFLRESGATHGKRATDGKRPPPPTDSKPEIRYNQPQHT